MSGTDKQIVIEALGGGPVQIGAGGPAPAGSVTLPLRTVVVVVNPAEPEEVPCCLAADVDEARDEIAGLYGDATAGLAAQAAGWDAPGRVGRMPFAPDDEDVAEAVARLGVVRWLQECSPLPLDWRLLRLEELTLVASLTGHLADEPDRLPELAKLCRYFHDHLAEEDFAPLTGLLGDALEQVADRSPLSGDSGDWAREVLATWPGAHRPVQAGTGPGRGGGGVGRARRIHDRRLGTGAARLGGNGREQCPLDGGSRCQRGGPLRRRGGRAAAGALVRWGAGGVGTG